MKNNNKEYEKLFLKYLEESIPILKEMVIGLKNIEKSAIELKKCFKK